MIRFHLCAPAIAAPGLDGWAGSRPVLAGERSYRPAPMPRYAPGILPPTAQRRGSDSTLLAVQVAQETLAAGGAAAQGAAAVFASSIGDPRITDQLCRALAEDSPMVSPTSFHNSVHNAPAGYWGIATGSLAPSTSVAAHDGSFAAGLLLAAVQCRAEGRAVLLGVYDLPYPPPLDRARPLSAPFATAALLTPEPAVGGGLECSLSLAGEVHEAALADPGLETLRRGNPAARALSLLVALARGGAVRLELDYLPGAGLVLEGRPC